MFQARLLSLNSIEITDKYVRSLTPSAKVEKFVVEVEDAPQTVKIQIPLLYTVGAPNIVHIPALTIGKDVLNILNTCLVSSFPLDTLVNVKFHLTDDIDYLPYLGAGFKYPYIHNQYLSLSRKIDDFSISLDTTLVYILDTQRNLLLNSKSCSLSTAPSDTLLMLLHNLVLSCGDREICGGLTLKKQLLELDTVVQGGEGCVVRNRRYSFHVHPQSFYKRYDVKNGFPSGADFYEFLSEALRFGLVMHLVATVEGMYSISLNEEWCVDMKELNQLYKSGGQRLRDYTRSTFITSIADNPMKFCEEVNKTPLFKGKPSVYKVEFMDWDKGDKFIVSFPTLRGDTCIIDQETLNVFASVEGISSPPW